MVNVTKAMSDPSKTSTLAVLHQQLHLPPPPPPASSPSSASANAGALVREYRKGNWTLQETLTLIAAKRLDDERRVGGSAGATSAAAASGVGGGGGPATPRSAEQRWKWVENYCWRSGCYRSQNQCNDKWDNLLRDYKKVRDYESRVAAAVGGADVCGALPSYWGMERHERKERNLPTNLAADVFESLTDVLSRRAARRANVTPISSRPPSAPSSPAKLLQLPPPAPPAIDPTPSGPPPAPAPPPPPSGCAQHSISAETSGSAETEGNEGATAEPDSKRRRLSSSVVRGATLLARTLLACEEKREQRHREMVELEERRLRLEEERMEVRRQGFAGLISAVNNLSGAIHDLVADHRNGEGR